jgi:hypothetical protein
VHICRILPVICAVQWLCGSSRGENDVIGVRESADQSGTDKRPTPTLASAIKISSKYAQDRMGLRPAPCLIHLTAEK